jgi:hypothetical protein
MNSCKVEVVDDIVESDDELSWAKADSLSERSQIVRSEVGVDSSEEEALLKSVRNANKERNML